MLKYLYFIIIIQALNDIYHLFILPKSTNPLGKISIVLYYIFIYIKRKKNIFAKNKKNFS